MPDTDKPERVRIVVKCRRAQPSGAPATPRKRFSARFVGGPHDGQFVDGCLSPEDAVGALVRQVAESLGSTEAVLTFIAGLFADLSVRSVNVALARAVWIAAQHPRRTNPGVQIQSRYNLRQC